MKQTSNKDGDNHDFLTTCSACGMPLPMAAGIPMAEACLKCYPNGPKKQKSKKDDDKSDKDADPKDQEIESFDDDMDDDDDDSDDDEEE